MGGKIKGLGTFGHKVERKAFSSVGAGPVKRHGSLNVLRRFIASRNLVFRLVSGSSERVGDGKEYWDGAELEDGRSEGG
jgi:hypothetical protein